MSKEGLQPQFVAVYLWILFWLIAVHKYIPNEYYREQMLPEEEIDHGLEPPKEMCLELVWIERRKAFQARRGTGVKIDTLYLRTQMKSRNTCLRKKKGQGEV